MYSIGRVPSRLAIIQGKKVWSIGLPQGSLDHGVAPYVGLVLSLIHLLAVYEPAGVPVSSQPETILAVKRLVVLVPTVSVKMRVLLVRETTISSVGVSGLAI